MTKATPPTTLADHIYWLRDGLGFIAVHRWRFALLWGGFCLGILAAICLHPAPYEMRAKLGILARDGSTESDSIIFSQSLDSGEWSLSVQGLPDGVRATIRGGRVFKVSVSGRDRQALAAAMETTLDTIRVRIKDWSGSDDRVRLLSRDLEPKDRMPHPLIGALLALVASTLAVLFVALLLCRSPRR